MAEPIETLESNAGMDLIPEQGGHGPDITVSRSKSVSMKLEALPYQCLPPCLRPQLMGSELYAPLLGKQSLQVDIARVKYVLFHIEDGHGRHHFHALISSSQR